MSTEHKNVDVSKNNVDLNDVEMIAGTQNSPKINRPDVHLITNERKLPKEQQKDHKEADVEHIQPLLESERDKQKPPLAGPEIDDLDDDKPADKKPFPGIDDGLLENGEKKPELSEGDDMEKNHKDPQDEGVGAEDGKWWHEDVPDYPYDMANGIGTRFGIDDRPGSPMIPGSIPDVNTYQQKKNLAQGMMDLALLSANANQLRYVLESASSHPYYFPSLAFISFSIILQIAVGVGLIMNSRYNVKDEKDICKADKINNMTVLGIFLITIVNVFITSFSVATPTTIAAQNSG